MTSMQTTSIVKKPGPPVPPRPQHATTTSSSVIATTLRTAQNRNVTKTSTQSQTLTSFATISTATSVATTTTTTKTTINPTPMNNQNNNNKSVLSLTTNTQNTAVEEEKELEKYSNNKQNPPIIHKKPIVSRQTSNSGRTVIYKSPSISAQQQQQQQSQQRQESSANTNHNVSVTMRTATTTKPPLKLRKAPDVPKQLEQQQQKSEGEILKELKDKQINNINLNRHNSMGCNSSPKTSIALKETRLSLGRADLDKFGGKIQLNQLQLSSQPLPKPRKIVQMPVATLDVEEQTRNHHNHSINVASVANIFRRSKTTLDNMATRNAIVNGNGNSNISSPNRFLGGKTIEIKNNLKNAAERLFAEIIVNQHHKHATEPAPTIITKHERALQHQNQHQQHQQHNQQQHSQALLYTNNTKTNTTNPNANANMHINTVTVAVNTTPSKVNITNNNCTRISINGGTTIETGVSKKPPFDSILNSPEKKQAFHEILISELAAMRAKSNSMENLQTKNDMDFKEITPTKCIATKEIHLRSNSVEEFEEDEEEQEQHYHEDLDADNIEDAEGDEDFVRKTFKLGTNKTTRKRCPSGCSSDSSPYGTERSARIRTSDWIEVQDNGKQVTLTSCHISLEDSGLEDEERIDDVSTSGVGDSWDSVRETQNEQRSRNINR